MNSNINMRKIYLGLSLLLIIFIFISLFLGDTKISIKEIMGLLTDKNFIDEKNIRSILFDVRLPRIFMAILIGMLLASSGTVVQTVFQNPLADPYIIGISASATFGAVIAYMLDLPDVMYGILGFVTSVVVSLIIFRLSKSKTKTDITTLLIVGIAISSFLIVTWMMGYIGAASWLKVSILIVPLVISIMYFYLKRHELDLLLSGDEEAHSLGLNVGKLKKNMLIVSSLIVGFSVAFTGMIGFVGLIVPHTIRLLAKSSSNTKLIPLSTLGGGLFLLICDTIGRMVLNPIEIPIGVVTAFFGAPFFLYLAIRRRGV